MQRLRIHYAKRGRLRFTSHRDFQRAFERALRRASVPMAYSAGFSPHPKISYVGASPTGVASEAEYLEIAVTSVVDPEELRSALDEALPAGLDVVEVVAARGGS
ncbi:MAG: TIGR03936 family radical SAM-associated protein, partial [Mycobacteriales bacterium]